jgi:hypothetical protein
MYSKTELFDKAVDITKEYSKGGGDLYPQVIFENVYNKLKEIAQKEGLLES